VAELSEGGVRTAVLCAVADLNESLPDERKLSVAAGGVDVLGALDSLGTLNFLLLVERRLEQDTGREWDLTGSDIYERTLFHAPTLDELVAGVFGALQATA